MLIRTSWMLGWGESGVMSNNWKRVYEPDYLVVFLHLKTQLSDKRCVKATARLPRPPKRPLQKLFLKGLFQGVLVEAGIRASVSITDREVIISRE